jgi:DNA-binding NarL/FixJ family response regulator
LRSITSNEASFQRDADAGTPGRKVGVLLCCTRALMRTGVALALERSEDVEVVAMTDDPMAPTNGAKPGLILLVPPFAGVETIDVVKMVSARGSATVAVLSSNRHEGEREAVVAAGADGYIHSTIMPSELSDELLSIAGGRA